MHRYFENKNFKKKAFTISELLIALGVIGILTAVLMPIMHSLIPDQNALMAKRAFYTIEIVTHGLLNDTGCYPPTRVRNGFGDGQGYRRCTGYPNGNADSPAEKFATLFIGKLDTVSDPVVAENVYTFNTKDGMAWSITTNDDGSATLTIDVNGNRRPNCGQTETSGICAGDDEGREKGFDTFTVFIAQNGQITVDDCWAALAVRTDKKLIGQIDVPVCD